MRIFIVIMILIASQFNFAQAHDCSSSKESMMNKVYADKNYKNYICGKISCNLLYFVSKIDIDCSEASQVGGAEVCFVTPKREARNYYTGVFVVVKNDVKEQFIFFGSGIGKATSITKKYFDLKGVEIQDAGQSYETVYRWNGEYYMEASGNEVDWK